VAEAQYHHCVSADILRRRQLAPHLVGDAEHGESEARSRCSPLREQTHENALWQDDPDDIPQNDLAGHRSSLDEDLP